ncbi:MAG: hypothetical protein WBI14_04065 [Anaerolineaceae bacterium]
MSVKTIESGTTIRTRLSKSIVLAMRKLMRQTQPDALSRDLAAFIVLALGQIIESVDQSVVAWEKRDYWLKADQFRREWAWAERSREVLTSAVLAQDWSKIIPEVAGLAQPLSKVQVSENHRLGEPWHGAWKVFAEKSQ